MLYAAIIALIVNTIALFYYINRYFDLRRAVRTATAKDAHLYPDSDDERYAPSVRALAKRIDDLRQKVTV